MMEPKELKQYARSYIADMGKLMNFYYPSEREAYLECRLDSRFTQDDLRKVERTISQRSGWTVHMFPHFVSRDIEKGLYESICRAVGGVRKIKRISISEYGVVVHHYAPEKVRMSDLEVELGSQRKVTIKNQKGVKKLFLRKRDEAE